MGYWSDVSVAIDDATMRLRESLPQLEVLRGFEGTDLIDDFESGLKLVKEEIVRARAEIIALEHRYGLENFVSDI